MIRTFRRDSVLPTKGRRRAFRPHSHGATARLHALAAALASAVLATPLHAQQDDQDYFNVKPNSDYYRYRYHSSYARRDQFLRTVEDHHLPQALQKRALGQYASAYEDFAYILGPFPNHPQALLGLEELCRKWKSPKCVLDGFLERAVAVNPKAPGTFVAQGIYLARNGRYPAAIDSYKRALELEPDSVNAHYNLGLAYLETKQYDLANQHAQSAYELGAPFRGLREKLTRAGHWRPGNRAPSGPSGSSDRGAEAQAAGEGSEGKK